jgi:hypothetical protein
MTDPINKVPAFRARLQSEGGYVACANFNYGNTGNTGPDADNNSATPNIYSTFDDATIDSVVGKYLRPSNSSSKPSMYRVLYDPIAVPSETNAKVGVVFESNAFVDPAAGILSLTELSVETFPAPTDSDGSLIFSYSRSATAASQNVALSFSGFNAENNGSAGYRQKLFVGSPFDSTPSTQLHTGSEQVTVNTTGITVDTVNCPSNVFGTSSANWKKTTNAAQPRIQPGKIYRAKFYACSDLDTWSSSSSVVRQGNVRFHAQTGGGGLNYYTELIGALPTEISGNVSYAISREALPGIGCLNPDFNSAYTPSGQDGGWYTILFYSPLDVDIRAEASGDINSRMADFYNQPGSGSSSASKRDIVLGVDLNKQPTTIKLGPSPYDNMSWAPANKSKVSVTEVRLYEIPAFEDCGYDTTRYP